MARAGAFDPNLVPAGWYDESAVVEGFFDGDFIPYAAAPSGVSITGATTNGADTSAGNIDPVISVTGTTTNGTDTSAGNIDSVVSVTGATTNGADTSVGNIDSGAAAGPSITGATINGADVSIALITVALWYPVYVDTTQAPNWQELVTS